ncbi:hypothetical protein H0O00_00155 [Candidatus Micrarchaeota archaeon]|nr:hypothetical protein [Candidatus Micrarchaeota archaeon]
MLHTKRLAYQDGKKAERPKQSKNLFFGAVCGAALTLFVSCAHADLISKKETPRPNREMPAWILAKKPKNEEIKGKCGADLTAAVKEGEKIVESICTDNYEYVLTQDDILIFPRKKPESMDVYDVKVTFSHMTLGVKNMIKVGVVDWEASDEGAYLLLRNKKVVMVPRESDELAAPTFELYFDVASMGKERMAYLNGYVVLAMPSGDILFLKDGEKRVRPSHISGPDATLHKTAGRLFFGKKDGADVEIKIDKDGPSVAAPSK